MKETHEWVPMSGGWIICRKCKATSKMPKNDSTTSGWLGKLLREKKNRNE